MLSQSRYRGDMPNDTERTSPLPNEQLPDERMMPVFSSSNHDAEMEALAVKGVLDANDIPAILVGPHVLPSLEFLVQVPQHLLGKAEQLLRDARQGGRRAADEGEALTE
jgi:hypothetical protein